MLHMPGKGKKVWAAGVYNRIVRALVKQNRSHSQLDDRWADDQVQEILARDEGEAREALESRFPPDAGFVVHFLTVARA